MKALKTISGFIAFISFILIVGVVGSLDMGNIGWGAGMTCIVVIGAVGVISGLIGFKEGR